MANYALGTAKGQIKVDYDGSGVQKATKDLGVYRDATGRLRDEHGKFVKSTQDAENATSKFGKSAVSTQFALGTVAAATASAARTIAGGLIYAAGKAIDFEKQISAIGAVSGATKDQLEALRKKALQLGADTVFSASDAARAMEELAKAGLPVADILNGAADATVALAAAGGVDLPEAASIAADAMSSFGLAAKDLMHVADLIAGAANASTIDVGEFGQAMKQAGAVAHIVGISFDDLATAIAIMGKQGIKGSDAGTSLKTMLLNLNPTTKVQIDLFRKLGLLTKDGANAFFTATGKAKSLAEISGVLQNSLKGMTQQQKLATLEILFGSDAIRAAAILSSQGAAGFNDMNKAMSGVTAASVAAKRLDNVAGSIEQLKGSVETLAITFGTLMLPVIRKVTDALTVATNWLTGLDPKWQKVIATVASVAAGFLALVAVAAAVGIAIIGIGASLVALKVAAIIAGIVAVVIALGLAFREAWQSSENFRNTLVKGWRAISLGVEGLLSTLRPLIDYVRNTLIPQLGNAFATAWQKMQPAITAISEFISFRLGPAFAKLQSALQTAMPTILAIARFLGTALVGAIKFVGEAIGFIIPLWLKLIGPVFSALISVLAHVISSIPVVANVIKTTIGIIVGVVQGFIAFWQAVWSVIGPPITAAFGAAIAVIRAAIAVISATLAVVQAVLAAVFGPIFSVIVPPVTAAFNAIRSVISSVLGFIVGFVAGQLEAVWNRFKFAFDLVRAIVSAVLGAVVADVEGKIRTVTSIFSTISRVADYVRDAFNRLQSAASGGTGSLVSYVSGVPGRVIGALGNLGGLLFGAGQDIIRGLLNGISSMAGAVISRAQSIANSVKSTIADALHIGSPSKDTFQQGKWTGKGFELGLVASIAGIVKAAEDMASSVSGVTANMPIGADFSAPGGIADSKPASSAQPAPPPAGPMVNQNFYVPNPMDPKDVATYSARRLTLALSGSVSAGG